jgi:hypothetical protein
LGFAYINSLNRRHTETFLGFGSELDSVATAPNTKITNTRNTDMPLIEYCMFASSNTAVTGSRVNLDMIANVLTRGCRFIDLEIYSIDGKPVIGYSTDIKNFNLEIDNTIPLSDALNKISTIGFAESPNSNDPIFINLRVKTKDAKLYEKIASTLDETVGPQLYTGDKIKLKETRFSAVLKKIIIILDDTIDYPPNNALLKYANLVMNKGGVYRYTAPGLSAQFIEPPRIKDNRKNTNVSKLKIVFPVENTNSNLKKFVTEYGTQVLANRFYQPDNNFNEIEKTFSDIGSAFVPMYQMLRYIKTSEPE